MIFMAMERNRDSRRANVSSKNGLRKRLRVTIQRDSTDEGVRSELLDRMKFGDPERLKKEKEREFTKRRRIDRCAALQRSGGDGSGRENESTNSSDEEYCVAEDVKVHLKNRFPSPSSISVVDNRRGFCDLGSSPVLRNIADEILGFPVPRRTRSATARKFADILNSGNGGFREDFGQRKISEPPTMVCSSITRAASPAPTSVSSVTTKSKTVFWNYASDSIATPADIEIEAAEALFDLMQQSYSQTQDRAEPEKLDRNRIRDVRDAKAKAGETVVDSIGPVKKQVGIEKDKSLDEGFEESMRGVEPRSKDEVGYPKESEMPSYVKANARDIQDPTATEANHADDSEAKRGTKLEIDLMASLPLPSYPERDALAGVDQQAVTKDGDGIGKKGHSIVMSQSLVSKASKNQLPTSVSGLFGGRNNLHGVLPHGGCMPQLQADYPTDGSARYMEPPQFKMSQPRPKKCALHHFIARDIQKHQQLIKRLSSSPTSPADICGSQMLNLNAKLTPQNHAAGNLLPEDSKVLKKSVSISDAPSSANGPLCGSGFIYPIGHLQPTEKLWTSSSVTNQTAGAIVERSMNLPYPRGTSTMNFNGCPIPISSNIALPPFKGVPMSSNVPPFDPSFYSPPYFTVNQNQDLSLQQKIPERKIDTSRSSIEHGRTSDTPTLGGLSSPATNPYSAQTGSILGQLTSIEMTPFLKLGAGVDPVLNFSSTAKRSTASTNSMMNNGQFLNFSKSGCADLPSAIHVTFPSFTEHFQKHHPMGQQLEVPVTAKHKPSIPTSVAAVSFAPGKWETSTIPAMHRKIFPVNQPLLPSSGSLRFGSSGGQFGYQEMEAPPNQNFSSPACRGNDIDFKLMVEANSRGSINS